MTGGAGFIGSHVVIRPVQRYPNVVVVNYDKLDYCACLANLDAVRDAPNYKFVKGDITSADLVNYVLETERIDTILHFAAQTHVDNSFGNSFAFTHTNVLGTHVLLEAAKRHGVQRFVHVSTDEVYGEGCEDVSSDERARIDPTNPYAATKAAAELLCRSYLKSFRLPVIITRGNNVYGPHQYPEKIIPKFISLLMAGEKLTVHGTGRNTRNYLFARDVAEAFDAVLHHGVVGETYNIGTERETSNLEVALSLLRLFGLKTDEEGGDWIEFCEDRPFNDLRYPLIVDKMWARVDAADKLGGGPERRWRVQAARGPLGRPDGASSRIRGGWARRGGGVVRGGGRREERWRESRGAAALTEEPIQTFNIEDERRKRRCFLTARRAGKACSTGRTAFSRRSPTLFDETQTQVPALIPSPRASWPRGHGQPAC